MGADTEPRAEFAAALREWFVDEVGRGAEGDVDGTDAPRSTVSLDDRPAAPRTRMAGRWLLIANAAAVIGLVVVLAWLGARQGGDAPSEEPVVTAPEADARSVAVDVCDAFRVGAIGLPLGASRPEVERAAADVGRRLGSASTSLDAVASVDDVDEARRLAGEAIEAADRLGLVADGDRSSIDAAASSVDLIIVAWERELAALAGDVCLGLPTLREVR